jgi:hypothetical protein
MLYIALDIYRSFSSVHYIQTVSNIEIVRNEELQNIKVLIDLDIYRSFSCVH